MKKDQRVQALLVTIIPTAEASVIVTVGRIQALANVWPNKMKPAPGPGVNHKEDDMTKWREKFVNFGLVGVLAVSFVFTIGQLVSTAQVPPVCEGLQCEGQQDCGSKCFCSRPTHGCFRDG